MALVFSGVAASTKATQRVNTSDAPILTLLKHRHNSHNATPLDSLLPQPDSPGNKHMVTPESDSGDVDAIGLEAESNRGWCLCLSGGGFRATLFHLGAIQRLNELGILAKLSTISSVSGGSILNGVMASRWARLILGPDGTYTNLQEEIAEPVREFCKHDLRTGILLGARLNPYNWTALTRDLFSVSANFLAQGYEPLYRCRLSDLPAPRPQVPRFVFCATNVRTGACWHFHGGPQAQMGDFYTGYCDARDVLVSDAVGASSAFPPGFSAFRLRLPNGVTFSRNDPWGTRRVISAKRNDQQHINLKQPILLADGGIYDNLAVEPIWQFYTTILVSDAGRPFTSTTKCGQGLLTRLRRASEISMEQAGAVRKRWLVADFMSNKRIGAIWTIHTRINQSQLADGRWYGAAAQNLLHRVRTDLDAFSLGEIACLENHGYSLADATVRIRAPALCRSLAIPFRWPHDSWGNDAIAKTAISDSHRRRIFRDTWRYLTRLLRQFPRS